MRELHLANGGTALVDDDVYERVAQWTWRKSTDGYPIRNTWRRQEGGRVRVTVYLHREAFNDPSTPQVDHLNGDRMDCRRENLRASTHKQNCQNRRKTRGASQYKGVSRRNDSNGPRIWRAAIGANGRVITIGHFQNEEDAARAYDTAARSIFGDYAKTNF